MINLNYILIFSGTILTLIFSLILLSFKNNISEKERKILSLKIKDNARKLDKLLKLQCPNIIDKITVDLYILPPFINKVIWESIGNVLKYNEQLSNSNINGSKWISLRLDGKSFSKLLKKFKSKNILSSGYSDQFALIMQKCCRNLMKEFNAKFGYTQSDEITILIPPTSIIRGKRQSHIYNGKTEKLCSLASSLVTANFNIEIVKACLEKKINLNEIEDKLPTFDCRSACYNSQDEALSLIFWRVYDCGINGISDAIYHSKISNRKKMMLLPTDKKLQVLLKNNLLPLPVHQAHGSFYCRVKRLINGYNPIKLEIQSSLRYKIERISGNILTLYQENKLILENDKEK